MRLDAYELAVMEQALREAINNGYDYRSVVAYRGLLSKLQAVPPGAAAFTLDANSPGPAGQAAEAGGDRAVGARWAVGDSPGIAGRGVEGVPSEYDDGSDLL
jgi:hypothetical protein